MKEDMQKELLNRLDLLAQKLGVTAEHLWRILVQQARVELIWDCVQLVLGAIFLGLAVRAFFFTAKLFKENHIDDVASLWLVVVSLGLSLMFFSLGDSALTNWLNPEFFAFRQIQELLK